MCKVSQGVEEMVHNSMRGERVQERRRLIDYLVGEEEGQTLRAVTI